MVDADVGELVASFREEMDETIVGAILGILAIFVVARFLLNGVIVGLPFVKEGTFPQFIAGIRTGLLETFGPLFLLLMLVFVLFCLVIVVGPWGSIRLGGANASPSYTYPAYFAMFFSAGIAAGIVFWGPAEALFHYNSGLAPFLGAQPTSDGAVTGALKTVFFHWGFSAWSSYVAVGVPIAYYAYNKGAPLRVSTLLVPFLGKRNLDHPVAKFVDVLAIFATIGGVGTSVGLIGTQFLAGITYQFGVQTGPIDTLIVIGGLTIVFTTSVVTGVKRGIRRIAAVNFGLFLVMALALLVLGPTLFIVTDGSVAFGQYLAGFVPMSLYPPLLAGTAGESAKWMGWWTLFYWVWWFSWAPFAGLFLAAISKGRTLRTVTATGMLATSAATLVWFAIISGTSLGLQHMGRADIWGAMNNYAGSPETIAAFPLLNALPLGDLLVFLFFALIITWMVTSADTSTLTISILASEQGVAPSTATRIFWGFLQGAFGAGLVMLGGGAALQSAAIVTGGPFGVIAFVGIVGLGKEFLETDVEGQTVVSAVSDAIESRGD
ncbi:MAG: BCCT family transporter [Haloarculaceae archaeon]